MTVTRIVDVARDWIDGLPDRGTCTLDGRCTDFRAVEADSEMRWIAWQHGDNPEHRSRVFDMENPQDIWAWIHWFRAVHERMAIGHA